MRELIFNVPPDQEGGFCAVAVGEAIFTEGDTWDELRLMVLDATNCFFNDSAPPDTIRLYMHVEQVIAVA
ncbi:MAG: 2-oxoisovalerate dehydrogenase E1 subunit beta [Acidobacteriaceae bacterium]|jgi:hypothetical protein